MMALTELDGVLHSTRSRAIALTPHVASRHRLILLHLGILTGAVLVAASTALGSPTSTPSMGITVDGRFAADATDRSAETESSSKPATERSPNAVPPAAKRQPTPPARKDRVLPNPPEYPPLGRELALR